ncbi:MAG: Gfo/Idh/MocA family oxidoreductase [Planctomycetota bacterium]|nr:Gfo/Idh/MocA family oxidoreductase [Planctomycetota bacterium]
MTGKDQGKKQDTSRRGFLKATAIAGAAAAAAPAILRGEEVKRAFKVALIGCGGRGSDALINNHHQAAKNLNKKLGWNLEIQVVATGDFVKGKAEGVGKRYGLGADKCFGGADCYKKVIEAGPEIVLMAQPPVFRPLHFEACIAAGKHVFFEKPSAVDPVGVRRVIKAGEAAKAKKLVVVAGTQRRHSKGYNERWRDIKDGALGRVMGGRVAWNMGWIFSNKDINATKPEQLVGSGAWQLWSEMSGDHICEQHVHNLDIANWYLDAHPLSAAGFGYRIARKAGNMYDFFSGDLEYPKGVHIHSMCRQIGGCWDWVGEEFTYEKNKPNGFKNETPDPYEEPGYEGGDYVAEHAHLLWTLVKEKELNEAQNVAWATAVAIMIRESAYSGQRISWADMYDKLNPKDPKKWFDLQLSPTAEDFEKGDVKMLKDGDIRAPGKA